MTAASAQGSSEGPECCDGGVVKSQGFIGESEKSRNWLDHEHESAQSPVEVCELKVASMQRPGEGSGCSDDVVKVARRLAMHTGLSIRSVVKQENVFDHVTETRSGVVRGKDQADGLTELNSIDIRGSAKIRISCVML